MLKDFFGKTTYSFSKEDKERSLDTVHRMIALTNLTRTYGIEALAEEMEQEGNSFLRISVNLLLDGVDPVSVRQILQNLVWAGQYRGHDLLNRLLIAEGILSIQYGESPRMLAMKLSSMLGENYFFTEARGDYHGSTQPEPPEDSQEDDQEDAQEDS